MAGCVEVISRVLVLGLVLIAGTIIEQTPSIGPKLSSDFVYHKKGSNWCTVVINANNITPKKAEISAMAEYRDPDLMLIT